MADGEKPAVAGVRSVSDVETGEVVKDMASKKDVDVAIKALSTFDPSVITAPITDEELRKLGRKVDFCILPMIAGSIILMAADKGAAANAANFGMKVDAHLVGNDYNWVSSILYFGYLAAKYPTAFCIQRLPVAKFGAVMVGCTGALMMFQTLCTSFASMAAVRFIMGMLESSVYPVSSIITVMWWTSKQQPIRAAFWNSQLAAIVVGLLAFGLGHSTSHLHPWRLLYLTLGAITVVWSIILWIFLPDTPATCWWLSERERFVIIERVRGNNTGIEDKQIKWSQVRECFADPKTWLLFVFALAQNIPNGAITAFSNIIVKGFGFTSLISALLAMPTGVIATLWQLILSFYVIKRFPGFRCITIAAANIIPLVTAAVEWKLPRTEKNALLALYYLYFTYWGPYVLATSLPMANVSGHSKKLAMNATMFMAYCLGNIIGPQVFRAQLAPAYTQSYEGLMACFVVASAAILLYGLLCYLENRKKDKENGAPTAEEVAAEAFSDLTDKQKKSFRYIY